MTPTTIYTRLVAAMIQRRLPAPESIRVAPSHLHSGHAAFVVLPDRDRNGVDRWTAALSLAKATDEQIFETLGTYETRPGGEYSDLIGAHVHVATLEPSRHTDEPDETEPAAELVLAAAQ
jgi:hypothetical protein